MRVEGQSPLRAAEPVSRVSWAACLVFSALERASARELSIAPAASLRAASTASWALFMLELTASSRAVVLPALAVESETECRVRPEEGYATYVLWEEARKALEITERTAAAYRFDAVLFENHVNLWGQPLEEGETQFVSYAGRHPFRSVSIDELEEHGYDWIRQEVDAEA